MHAVKSITGGASGSSSTPQPLFYGAALSSVTALTPHWGVARERAFAWARTSAYLSVCARAGRCTFLPACPGVVTDFTD